jgi:hypothetical protein
MHDRKDYESTTIRQLSYVLHHTLSGLVSPWKCAEQTAAMPRTITDTRHYSDLQKQPNLETGPKKSYQLDAPSGK